MNSYESNNLTNLDQVDCSQYGIEDWRLDIPEQCYSQVIEDTCKIFSKGYTFIQLTNEYNEELWFEILALFSCYFGGFFAYAMWRMKELHVHPIKTIILVSALECMYIYIIICFRYVCTFNLYDLLALTLFGNTDGIS